MTRHDVRIEPRWFERIRLNEKFAEVRYDDRDYQTGDTVRFRRQDEDGTRAWHFVERRITHVLRAGGFAGLEDGYVVLSLADPRVAEYRERWENALERERHQENRIRGLRGQITRLHNKMGGRSA